MALVFLALTVPFLSLRYTFDGWGFLVLIEALGDRSFVHRTAGLLDSDQTIAMRLGRIEIAMTLIGMGVSHLSLLRYKINHYGTTPEVRYWLSKELQPLFCPHAALTPNIKLTDFVPLVTPNCPPLW